MNKVFLIALNLVFVLAITFFGVSTEVAADENSDRVVQIQELLTKLGFQTGPVDGKVSESTVTAMSRFLLFCGTLDEKHDDTVKRLYTTINDLKGDEYSKYKGVLVCAVVLSRDPSGKYHFSKGCPPMAPSECKQRFEKAAREAAEKGKEGYFFVNCKDEQ